MTNCDSCRWQKIKGNRSAMAKNGVTDEDIREKCRVCAEEFGKACRKRPPVCFDCAWKDRNLPYEARKLHCKACVEAFASVSRHDCGSCIWNNPKRRQPSDASLAHCKACVAATGASKTAMNCETCAYRGMPEETRRPQCLKCSLVYSANAKVKGSTNELSNKGRTIISYDNHNTEMTDDRDTVSQIARDYTITRKSESGVNSQHPVFKAADRAGMTPGEFAEEAYEKMKLFLYEFGQLTDMQVLLFLSEVKGEQKTDFAKNHNMTDSMVNGLSKQLMARSPVFRDFIILSRGTLEGTRGRKPKNGIRGVKVIQQTRTKKVVYAGVFQPSLGV